MRSNTCNMKLQLSLMMFIQFFMWGAWYVTLGTYLGQTLGFSGTQIGLAYGTVAVASIISPSIVGMIADRYFSPNKVMAVLNAVGAVLLISLTQVREFSLFFPLLLLYAICYMPTIALSSSICFDNLKNPAKEFSRIRLLGSIGWIASGVTLSALGIEHLSTPFVIAAISSVLGMVISLMLPMKEPQRSDKELSFCRLLGFDAFRLMRTRSFALLVVFSALTCIPLAFYDSFTNLFLNDIEMTNTAAAMSLGQVAEIMFLFTFPFFFAKLRYKGSIGIAILIWMCLYGFFAITAMTGNTAFVYAALPLHGFCFTFFFVSGQLFVDEYSPNSLRSSAQGLIAFATYGVGKFLGTFVAGQTVDHYTVGDSYDWGNIWTVPFILVVTIFIGFAIFFKEDKSAKPVETLNQ